MMKFDLTILVVVEIFRTQYGGQIPAMRVKRFLGAFEGEFAPL